MHVAFAMNLWLENVGIMQVMSALVARGHRVSLVISVHPSRLLRRIARLRPDILALSLTTNNYRWAEDLAARIRKILPELHIIAGGAHASLFPTFCEGTEIDAVCVGEGDEALAEWVDRLAVGESGQGMPNIGQKADGKLVCPRIRPLINPLDDAPYAHRDAFYRYSFFRNSRFKSFLASRGCVHSCRFCYNAHLRQTLGAGGTYRRIMSPARVVDEVAGVCRVHPTRVVIFEDDCFPHNTDWLQDFADLYRRRVGLPFLLNTRADLINDDNVRLCKAAGVSTISMGVQTGSEDRRLKQLGTGVRDEHLLAAADVLRRHNVPFLTYNMFGLPGETVDDAYQTIVFNRQLGAAYGRFVMFQPYAGLPLAGDTESSNAIACDSATVYYSSATREARNPELVNLQNFSNWMLTHWRHDSLARALTRWPPNPLFKAFFWYTLFSGLRTRLHLNWLNVWRMLLQNLR